MVEPGTADPLADPCAALRGRAAARCADAADLAIAASERAAELRRLRHTADQLERETDRALRATDHRALRAAKEEAQARHRLTRRRLPDGRGRETAAAEWLAEIDRLNRAARAAASVFGAGRPRADVGADLARLTLEADAARIAAEAAAADCQAARSALARCEEAAVGTPATPASGRLVGPDSAVVALCGGDDGVLADLARRAAATTALAETDSRRLLSLLAGALVAGAVEQGHLRFAVDHPFWRQFPPADARQVARSLAALGRGFDGAGWANGRPAEFRQIAMAVGDAGYDVRALRHLPNASEMPDLWRGTVVDVHEHLAAAAPDLALDAVMALARGRAAALGPLWDNWGRLRPLLLSPPGGGN